jgi:putative nucleotidyltransferase with HDIG domain
MIRVLFVDDEINVLQGMRRSMQDMQKEWSMEFASSGAAALDSLAKTPADVILSDMRMPGMDGWQLLSEVKKRHPQMLRLVLSGPTDPSCIMRSIGAAHEILPKPCDSAALKAVISRANMLKQLLGSERLAKLLARLGVLPRPPKVFNDMLTYLQLPLPSVPDAARIMSDDAPLTANVVKLANSAFFGSRQPIITAARAAAYLGPDILGALVLGLGVFKSGAPSGIQGFSLERLWRHSLETAIAARTVARSEKLSPAQADEAFVAGMLHDVGKVVFAARPAAATNDPISAGTHATAQMEAHHAEVGACLLASWGFPNSIVEAVAFHHTPGQAVCSGLCLTKLVHIADRLVHQRRAEYSGPFERGLEAELLAKLKLTERWPEWLAALDSFDFVESAA